MCLAIMKPPGNDVPGEALEYGFADNPDGAGFAYARHGNLFVHKGFFKFDHFLHAYGMAVRPQDPAIIHFRYATSGRVDRHNCHPFLVSPSAAVVHNGVLPWQSTRRKSDTAHFTRDVLAPSADRIHDPGFQKQIEAMIGPNNKFAFLDHMGRTAIYHEGSGEWVDGIWYSRPQFCGPAGCEEEPDPKPEPDFNDEDYDWDWRPSWNRFARAEGYLQGV